MLTKALSFGLVGVINTGVDLGVFSLGYYYAGLPILASNILAWAVAVTCSYVLNGLITFAKESEGKLSFKTYIAYAISQGAGFAANTVTVLAASYFVPVIYGKLLATVASFIVNFSVSNFMVFRGRKTPAP